MGKQLSSSDMLSPFGNAVYMPASTNWSFGMGSGLKAMVVLFLFANIFATVASSPCVSYRSDSIWQRSTRYILTSSHGYHTDRFMRAGWYRFTSKAGGTIPHYRVPKWSCGARYPIFISNGRLPTVALQETDLRICYEESVPNGCVESFSIKAKLCTTGHTQFYIYQLKAPLFDASYCAGSEIPCRPGYSSPTGFTVNGKCNKDFPLFSTPRLHYAIIGPEGSNLYFVCNFTTKETTASDFFKLTWRDSSFKTYERNITGVNYTQNMIVKFEELKEQSGFQLGDTFTCTVQSFFGYSPRNTSNVRLSNYFFAGIRAKKRNIHLEEWNLDSSIAVESTIPVFCKDKNIELCMVKVEINRHLWIERAIADNCFLRFWRNAAPQTTALKVAVAQNALVQQTEHRHISLLIKPWRVDKIWERHKDIPHIQVTISDKKWGYCHSSGDPHFKSFGGLYYHHYKLGDYELVATKNKAFEVHVRTWQCASVTCNCGVAAREGEDIVIIDMCKDSIPRPRLPKKREMQRSEHTLVTVDSSGRHFTISFPSGATIKFNTYYWSWGKIYYGDITVKLPGIYHGQTGGLCGTYDDNSNNELISRDGKIWDRSLPSNRIGPPEFTESWKLHTGHSLFFYKPSDVKCKVKPQEKSYCNCVDTVENTVNCSKPIGVEVNNVLGQKIIRFANEDYCSRRKRRSVGTSDDVLMYPDDDDSAYYEYDPAPLNVTIPVWPTKTGKTKTSVQKYCNESIVNSPIGKLCKMLDSFDFGPHIDQCVEDIKITDDLELATATVQSLAEVCKDEVLTNVTFWSGNASSNGTLTPPLEILAVSCPSLCSGKGTCVNGTCVCNDGFSGPDCSVNATAGPTFRSITNNGFCDIRKRSDCSRILVIGRDFISSKSLVCRISPMLFGSSTNMTTDQFITRATMLSFSEVICEMIENPVKSFIPSSKGMPYALFKVEVSNDGKIFSKQSHNYTIYDSKCINCTKNGTCQLQPKHCLINGYCFDDREPHPRTPCLRCDPSYNFTAFHPVKTGSCAATTTTKTAQTTPAGNSSSTKVTGNPKTAPSSDKATSSNVTGNPKTVPASDKATFSKAHSKKPSLRTTMSTVSKTTGKMVVIISTSTVGGIVVLILLILCLLKCKKTATMKTLPIVHDEVISNNIALANMKEQPSPQ